LKRGGDTNLFNLAYDYAQKANAVTNRAIGLFELAVACWNVGKYDEATNAITRAVDMEPTSSMFLENKKVMYEAIGPVRKLRTALSK
jgi:tetratricopeptide (TPR) repeat protein